MHDIKLLAETYLKEIAVNSDSLDISGFKNRGMIMAPDTSDSYYDNFLISAQDLYYNTDMEIECRGVVIKVVDDELFYVLEQLINTRGYNTNITKHEVMLFNNPEKKYLTNERHNKIAFIDLEYNYVVLYAK